jgi:hypothetical protein
MEDRWVTNLSEDRKRFYLVSSLLDPRTKLLSFCDNKYFPSLLGEVKDLDGQVKHRSDLDELLGMSTVSMDFDVVSVEGEAHLQSYMQVQQVTNDTDPLMWWKQHP